MHKFLICLFNEYIVRIYWPRILSFYRGSFLQLLWFHFSFFRVVLHNISCYLLLFWSPPPFHGSFSVVIKRYSVLLCIYVTHLALNHLKVSKLKEQGRTSPYRKMHYLDPKRSKESHEDLLLDFILRERT